MSGGWERSTPDRKSRLPPKKEWDALIVLVRERAGGRCEMRMKSGKRCHDPGKDCDHIVRSDTDHSLANLQWICTWHHRQKTSREGNDARKRVTAKHPGEKHPSGLNF